MKGCKEQSMSDKLTSRFEEGLEKIKTSLSKARGIKEQGIHHSWRRIRNIMSSQTLVTTRMKFENGDSLILRNATRPSQEQAKIYHALNFKQADPKMRKKAVVPHE